jgi:hypothetical protein
MTSPGSGQELIRVGAATRIRSCSPVGYEVGRTRKGHLKLVHDSGAVVIGPGTPGDHRSWRNTSAQLKRSLRERGIVVEERRLPARRDPEPKPGLSRSSPGAGGSLDACTATVGTAPVDLAGLPPKEPRGAAGRSLRDGAVSGLLISREPRGAVAVDLPDRLRRAASDAAMLPGGSHLARELSALAGHANNIQTAGNKQHERIPEDPGRGRGRV